MLKMEIISKMLLFVVMTIFVMIILALLIVPLSIWIDAGVATLISTILFATYLICFDIINERKRWMKF